MLGDMYLTRRIKVPQWTALSFFYAIIFLSTTIRPAVCSDSSLFSNTYASSQRRVPPSGSGGGSPSLGKRSSYAVISQAMSETINSEFGSEYRCTRIIWRLFCCSELNNRWWCPLLFHGWIFKHCGEPQVTTNERSILTIPTNISSSFCLKSTNQVSVQANKRSLDRHDDLGPSLLF